MIGWLLFLAVLFIAAPALFVVIKEPYTTRSRFWK